MAISLSITWHLHRKKKHILYLCKPNVSEVPGYSVWVSAVLCRRVGVVAALTDSWQSPHYLTGTWYNPDSFELNDSLHSSVRPLSETVVKPACLDSSFSNGDLPLRSYRVTMTFKVVYCQTYKVKHNFGLFFMM